METLQPIELNEATGEAKALLDRIQQRLPRVPNMLRLLASLLPGARRRSRAFFEDRKTF